MKSIPIRFLKTLFFFVLLSTSVVGQVYPTDDTTRLPSGYTLSQARLMNAIAVDTNGNKWIGFNLIGLGKLNASKAWTIYDSLNSPLPNNTILSVCCNASGVWAGTNSGLYNFNGTNWTSYTTSNSNIPSDTVLHLYSAGGNNLMIFSDKGVVYFNGTSFTSYHSGNSGLVNDTVLCVFQSSTGMWWIGTVHGLSSFDGITWQSYTKANAFRCDDYILSLNEDKNNTLFVGTYLGPLIKSGTSFVSMDEYLGNYLEFPKNILNLLRLSDGRIYISSAVTRFEYIISTNPVSVTIKKYPGGLSTTDSYLTGVMDNSDRIWWISRPVTTLIRMTDSLLFYPDTLPFDPPGNYKFNYLDINEVKCPVWNDNTFFWRRNANSVMYEVPKNSCLPKNAVFASALWLGGLDPSGKIHLAAQTYRQSGDDFWPGPLDTVSAKIDSVTLARYDSTWKVNRKTINEFIAQYNLGNITKGLYKIPWEILGWPAHGKGNISRNLAPFVDANHDGVYNPYHGDYPDIKGDQMLWWVMNDHYKDVHGETGGIPLGVEIQSKAYAYSCPDISSTDEAVNYTTFYSFDMINRSDTDYHDVYVGIWVDTDLGYYLDDYVGCRIEGDYGFAYNGDNDDEGSAGYGVNPPMLSVAVLKGPQAEPNDGIDNNHNGVTDEVGENCMMNHFTFYQGNSTPWGSIPFTPKHYYYYLKSLWKDSSHVKYGGAGFGNNIGCGATNNPTDYMFSGMPYDTGWTEANACNLADDRRFLMSSGPFALRSGESRTIDYAIVFSWDKDHPNGLTTSVAKNHNDVMNVKRWFEANEFPCNHADAKIDTTNLFFDLYPNPAKDHLYLVFRSNGSANAEMDLIDITGRIVKQQIVFPNQKNIIDIRNVAKGMYLVRVKDPRELLYEK